MGQDTESQQKKTEAHTNQAVSEHDNYAEAKPKRQVKEIQVKNSAAIATVAHDRERSAPMK